MNAVPSPMPSLGVPPLDAVQAALRKTTETLAGELARPNALAPDWTESEWLVARAVAAIHGISPLLSRSLLWPGAPGWERFLNEQRIHTENRYARIQELLQLVDDGARRAGIALVALKGAALHALDIYVPGERPMADLDLLVREEDSHRTGHMIEGLGFHTSHTTWKHRVFEPNGTQTPAVFGENSANGMKIELHSYIREPLPLRMVDVTNCIFPRQPQPGMNAYPSNAALMTHLLLHAAGAMAFRAIRALNLIDIARLSARMTDQDWDEVFSQEAHLGQTLWWAFPPLALTARYYPGIPDRVLTAMSVRCPWLLKQACRRRTLSDVSLSHLWITAFPGIEWARSPREMLTYVLQRVAPSAELKSQRKLLPNIQAFASETPWARMSQSRRIANWLTSRPARAESLRPVRTALAQSE
jgi:hypothetical protein